MRRGVRRGQFFIITAVLIAGALLTTTTILSSSQTVTYNNVLEKHDTDVVGNMASEIQEEWWNVSWSWRKNVVVEERSGVFLTNESVELTLDARRSRLEDDCADIRVIADGEELPWIATTGCDIDTYSSDTGAVAQYRLDDVSGGQVEDATGHGHTGSLIGSPAVVSGRFVEGLRFDGSSRVEVTGMQNLDDDVVAMAWVRPDSDGTIVADDDNDNGWFLTVDSGRARFVIRGEADLSGGPLLTDGAWHHVTGVLDTDAGTQSLYVDGELVDDQSAGAPSTDSGLLTFGGQGTGPDLTGSLDDVRVYNVSMDAGTVAGVARNGAGVNVSVTLLPRETKRLQVYYGNPSANPPSYTRSDLAFTVLDERPSVSMGEARGIREVMRKLQERVEEMDAVIGANMWLEIRRGCNQLVYRSPRVSLVKNLC